MTKPVRTPPRPIVGYFKDPNTWNRLEFETLIRAELESVYGAVSSSDEALLGNLIVLMDSLMESQLRINEEGYVSQYAAGVGTSGWVKLRNESIDKIIKIFGELGLVARGRPKKQNKASEVDELFATA